MSQLYGLPAALQYAFGGAPNVTKESEDEELSWPERMKKRIGGYLGLPYGEIGPRLKPEIAERLKGKNIEEQREIIKSILEDRVGTTLAQQAAPTKKESLEGRITPVPFEVRTPEQAFLDFLGQEKERAANIDNYYRGAQPSILQFGGKSWNVPKLYMGGYIPEGTTREMAPLGSFRDPVTGRSMPVPEEVKKQQYFPQQPPETRSAFEQLAFGQGPRRELTPTDLARIISEGGYLPGPYPYIGPGEEETAAGKAKLAAQTAFLSKGPVPRMQEAVEAYIKGQTAKTHEMTAKAQIELLKERTGRELTKVEEDARTYADATVKQFLADPKNAANPNAVEIAQKLRQETIDRYVKEHKERKGAVVIPPVGAAPGVTPPPEKELPEETSQEMIKRGGAIISLGKSTNDFLEYVRKNESLQDKAGYSRLARDMLTSGIKPKEEILSELYEQLRSNANYADLTKVGGYTITPETPETTYDPMKTMASALFPRDIITTPSKQIINVGPKLLGRAGGIKGLKPAKDKMAAAKKAEIITKLLDYLNK